MPRACRSLRYKYMAAAHVTLERGKEVALVAIVQGNLITSAVQQGLSLSMERSNKKRSLRKRAMSMCGLQ